MLMMPVSRRAFAGLACLLALAACRPETELTRMAAANDSGALNVQLVRVAGNVGITVDPGLADMLRDAVQGAAPRDLSLPANALIEITLIEVTQTDGSITVKGLARLRSLRGFTRAEFDLAGSSSASDNARRQQEIAAVFADTVRREIAARGL